MLAMKSYGITDTGLVRLQNEDWFDADDALQLYLVADGMGGHAGGRVASRLAVSSVHDTVVNELAVPGAADDLPDLLTRSFHTAHAAIVSAVAKNLSLLGMGTTIIAAMLRRETLTLAHLGDCRAYRLRDSAFELLTEDHTWVGDQIRAGALTEEKARKHPMRNVVTRALGGYRDADDCRLEVEITKASVRLGDTFLLCSDGLTAMLTDEEIDRELRAKRPLKEMGRIMVRDANARGGPDNTTVVLLRADDIPADELSRRRNPALYHKAHTLIQKPRHEPAEARQTSCS